MFSTNFIFTVGSYSGSVPPAPRTILFTTSFYYNATEEGTIPFSTEYYYNPNIS